MSFYILFLAIALSVRIVHSVKTLDESRKSRQAGAMYVMAWNAKHKQEGQHQGPITAAHQRVLHKKFRFWAVGGGLPEFEPGPIQATLARSASCCTPIADLEAGLKIQNVQPRIIHGRKIVGRR